MTIADASWSLQVAIVAALQADATVASLVTDRIFDVPRQSTPPAMPYISIGSFDTLTEVADDYEGSDTSIQIDGWDAGPGSKGIKVLGRAIRAALHEKDLSLADNQRLVQLTVDRIQYLREPDGVTQHAVVTVRALTEPTA